MYIMQFQYKLLVPDFMTDDDTYVVANSYEILILISVEKMDNWICFSMCFFLYFWSSCWLSLFYLISWQAYTCFFIRSISSYFYLQIKSLWHLSSLCFPEFCIAQGNKHLMQKSLISLWYLFISDGLDIYCLMPFQ